MFRWIVLIALCAPFPFFAAPSAASPRIINDNRLAEIGMTPALGRGYSLTSNSLHSLCYKTVAKTVPTYNLDYEFQEIDETYMNRTSIQTKLATAYLHDFLKKNVAFSEVTQATGNTTKTYKIKNILAHIKVSTYYYSLDESQSELGDSAKKLLNGGDLVGFFESCGFYYIRSLGRYSTFMALFKYRLDENESDEAFMNALHRKMFSFYKPSGEDTAFENELERRVLRINVQAVGLGKGNMVNLLPTNLHEFKKTIEEAVKLMQDPNSGAITSMEVVPWPENTEFQTNMKLDREATRLAFTRRKNLEENSGVIAEIERIDRYQMDLYYKAFACHRVLMENYKVGTGPFEYDPKRTFFYDLANKTNRSQYKSLEELLTLINEKSVESLYNDNMQFLYGQTGGKSDGAAYCMQELERQGLENVSYRSVPACREVMRYPARYLPIIDHYCLPEQAEVELRPIIPRPPVIGPIHPRPIDPRPIGPR